MKKRILILIILVSAMSYTYAQDYTTGIGLRGGLSNGVTIKHFIGEKSALEGLIAIKWKGYSFTGLYEINNEDVFDVNRLNWYYGIGGHIGFWNGDDVKWGDPGQEYIGIGVDAIIGIEYNFEEVPINISVDWKPAFNIIGYSGFWPDGGALSIRYIF